VYPNITAFLPVIYELDPEEVGSPPPSGGFDELTAYVSGAVAGGRKLFDVLADEYVLERVDEYVSVLDHLARQPAVREAVALCGVDAVHRYSLAA
jgi:hypothetical protein